MTEKYLTLIDGKMKMLSLGDIPVDALTEFEAFTSDDNQSTTSNGYVTKSGFPYTTILKTAGEYIIDFTAEVGQTDKEKQVGFRVQWRIGVAGGWTTLSDTRNALAVDDEYGLRTGFRKVILGTDSVFQVRLRWGQTDDGGSGLIRNAGIKVGKVAG